MCTFSQLLEHLLLVVLRDGLAQDDEEVGARERAQHLLTAGNRRGFIDLHGHRRRRYLGVLLLGGLDRRALFGDLRYRDP